MDDFVTDTSDHEENYLSRRRGTKILRFEVQCKSCGSMKIENCVIIHSSSCVDEVRTKFHCCCEKILFSLYELSIHRVICGMSTTCVCGKYFTTKKMYSLHVKTCTLALKVAGCSNKVVCKCGKECRSLKGLKQHQKICRVTLNYIFIKQLKEKRITKN